jgi:hypothetical protein
MFRSAVATGSRSKPLARWKSSLAVLLSHGTRAVFLARWCWPRSLLPALRGTRRWGLWRSICKSLRRFANAKDQPLSFAEPVTNEPVQWVNQNSLLGEVCRMDCRATTRQPVFLRLREEKDASDCTFEGASEIVSIDNSVQSRGKR